MVGLPDLSNKNTSHVHEFSLLFMGRGGRWMETEECIEAINGDGKKIK